MSQDSESSGDSPTGQREAAGQRLRQRAEEIALEMGIESNEQLDTLSVEKVGNILHELYVHQIELEMQNEELLRMQVELDAARARYFDLYEMAPSGYCTLDEKGGIVETNLTLATFLGTTRGELTGRPLSAFLLPEDQDIFYLLKKSLLKSGQAQTRDLRMMKKDATALRVNLVVSLGYAVQDGSSELRCMMTPIAPQSL